MRLVGILLLFGGYTLVYAAVARGGKYATEPWAGLFADAYVGGTTDTFTPPPGFSPLSPTPPAGFTPRRPRPRQPRPAPTTGHGGTF